VIWCTSRVGFYTQNHFASCCTVCRQVAGRTSSPVRSVKSALASIHSLPYICVTPPRPARLASAGLSSAGLSRPPGHPAARSAWTARRCSAAECAQGSDHQLAADNRAEQHHSMLWGYERVLTVDHAMRRCYSSSMHASSALRHAHIA
jgi:hypothetical protein